MWCRDFTIICITKTLQVKIWAYASVISDFPKSYRVEKLVLHPLIFHMSIYGSKRNFIPHPFAI